MATQAPITHFEPDPDRLAVIAECTQDYDVAEIASAEWPNNLLSRRTVVYESGRIARAGDEVSHAVDPSELELCRRLSSEVAALMAGTEVGMVSEASVEFGGFFIAGNAGETLPTAITEALIWEKFGGTIFPRATVTVEPLAEQGVWWKEVETDFVYEEEADKVEHLGPWRRMIGWFKGSAEFVDSAFVRIGDCSPLLGVSETEYPEGTVETGSALPRLALGLTRGGSLVGLFGHSVQTCEVSNRESMFAFLTNCL